MHVHNYIYAAADNNLLFGTWPTKRMEYEVYIGHEPGYSPATVLSTRFRVPRVDHCHSCANTPGKWNVILITYNYELLPHKCKYCMYIIMQQPIIIFYSALGQQNVWSMKSISATNRVIRRPRFYWPVIGSRFVGMNYKSKKYNLINHTHSWNNFQKLFYSHQISTHNIVLKI